MGKNVLKSSPLKPVSQYSKHVIDGRRFLNIFPIGSYVKTMSTDGGHLGWSFGSLDIILKVDHLRTATVSRHSFNIGPYGKIV
jgi:hypothetical protein